MRVKSFFFSLLFILNISSNVFGDTMINGSGASFPFPLYSKWFYEYYRLNPDVKINYQSIGSSAGIRMLIRRRIDFAASDLPMNDRQIKQANKEVLHLPTAIGAVVMTYNIPNLKGDLRLSGEIIAQIFMGKIKSWDHELIKNLNPTLSLPKLPIVVVHRSDGSGTTAIFTSFLLKASESWNSQLTGTSLSWPEGLGAKGNEGVAGLIKQQPGSLGYIEWQYATENGLSYALIKNKSGEFIKPSTLSMTAAYKDVEIPTNLRMASIDPHERTAYPICGLTYLLVSKNPLDVKNREFFKFLNWSFHQGQQYIEKYGYAPLPSELLKKVLEKVDKV